MDELEMEREFKTDELLSDYITIKKIHYMAYFSKK